MNEGNGSKPTNCRAEAKIFFENVVLTMRMDSPEQAKRLCDMINGALASGKVMYFAPPPPPPKPEGP